MIITKITELSKARKKIEIDGEFAFVLYKGELPVFGIKEGCEIKKEVYQEIMTKILPKRAKLRAMNLLKSRAYTTVQLTEKLKTGGYPSQIIREAIDYVSSFGYVNDRQYAYDFIEYNKESKSKGRIMSDLQRKGISKDMAEEAWEEVVGENREELEKEQMIKLLEKKHFSSQRATLQESQKMMAFLYRKGFAIETIRNVLSLDITTI